MIEYLYTSKYESGRTTGEEETEKDSEVLSELRLHAELYAVADKYSLPSLADHAKSKYTSIAHDLRDPYDFIESIDAIYTLTPESNRGLRNVAVACTRLQGIDFTEEKAHALMKRICLQVPEYAFDIVESVMRKPILGRCCNCGPGHELEVFQFRCLQCGKWQC